MNRALVKIKNRFFNNNTHGIALIYCYIDENGIIKDNNELKSKFSPDGTVFWSGIPHDINDSGYYWVELKETDTGGDARNCNFRVRQSSMSSNIITRATEFICDGIGGRLEYELDFRKAFIEIGIQSDVFVGESVKFYYQLPQILCNELALSKNSWLGPIELFLNEDSSSYKLKKHVTELEIREVDSLKILELDNGLRFSWQRTSETKVIGYLNLASDVDIAKNINKEIYLDLPSLNATSLSNRTIEALKKRINAATLLYDSDTLKYKAFLHRIHNLIFRTDAIHCMKKEAARMIDFYITKNKDDKNAELLNELFYENQNSEDNNSSMTELEEFEQEKLAWEASWNQEKLLKEEEENKRSAEFERQLDLLKEDIQKKELERNEQQAALDNLKVAKASREKELRESLNKILDEFKPLLSSLTYLQEGKNAPEHRMIDEGHHSPFSWSSIPCPDYTRGEAKIDFLAISNSISEHATFYNIKSARLKDALFSIISSKIPCFTGPTALDGAQALASIIASENYIIVSVPAAVFSIYDLFGKTESDTGRIKEPLYRLLSFLFNAYQKPEQVFAVILEGLNRCPIESYFDSLMQAYFSECKKAQTRIEEKEAMLIPQIIWPSNVYLIGTLIRGRTAFKMDPEYLRLLELVDSIPIENEIEDDFNKCCHNDFILNKTAKDPENFKRVLTFNRSNINATRETVKNLLVTEALVWDKEKQKYSQENRDRIEYNRYYIDHFES